MRCDGDARCHLPCHVRTMVPCHVRTMVLCHVRTMSRAHHEDPQSAARSAFPHCQPCAYGPSAGYVACEGVFRR